MVHMKFKAFTGAFATIFALASAQQATANINLELRPTFQSVLLGSTFNVGLFAVSDNPIANQSTSALQVILTWDPAFVQLAGLDNTGSPLNTSAFIPGDPFGLNASTTDGDALWNGFSQPGVPVQATPTGTFLTNFVFNANNITLPTTFINIPATGGNGGFTAVYGGGAPGQDVTGTLTGATVQVLPVPAPGALAMVLAAAALGSRRRRR